MTASSKRAGRRRWGLVAAIAATRLTAVGVCAGPAAANAPDPNRPDVELTVDASIDRPFTWAIEKTADKENVTLQPGETTTVAYSVTLTPTEGTTTWSAVGEIVVYNKELEGVTVNSVTNVISGVGPATMVCPTASRSASTSPARARASWATTSGSTRTRTGSRTTASSRA
jgi:hypothetical protein